MAACCGDETENVPGDGPAAHEYVKGAGERLCGSYVEMALVCSDCGVIFEREPGEITGSTGINITVTLFVFFVGLLALQFLTSISALLQLLIWMPAMLLFLILFCPFSRGL